MPSVFRADETVSLLPFAVKETAFGLDPACAKMLKTVKDPIIRQIFTRAIEYMDAPGGLPRGVRLPNFRVYDETTDTKIVSRAGFETYLEQLVKAAKKSVVSAETVKTTFRDIIEAVEAQRLHLLHQEQAAVEAATTEKLPWDETPAQARRKKIKAFFRDWSEEAAPFTHYLLHPAKAAAAWNEIYVYQKTARQMVLWRLMGNLALGITGGIATINAAGFWETIVGWPAFYTSAIITGIGLKPAIHAMTQGPINHFAKTKGKFSGKDFLVQAGVAALAGVAMRNIVNSGHSGLVYANKLGAAVSIALDQANDVEIYQLESEQESLAGVREKVRNGDVTLVLDQKTAAPFIAKLEKDYQGSLLKIQAGYRRRAAGYQNLATLTHKNKDAAEIEELQSDLDESANDDKEIFKESKNILDEIRALQNVTQIPGIFVNRVADKYGDYVASTTLQVGHFYTAQGPRESSLELSSDSLRSTRNREAFRQRLDGLQQEQTKYADIRRRYVERGADLAFEEYNAGRFGGWQAILGIKAPNTIPAHFPPVESFSEADKSRRDFLKGDSRFYGDELQLALGN